MRNILCMLTVWCCVTGGVYAQAADATAAAQYTALCGQCHMAYPPQLLPSGSWQQCINDSDNHFGEQLNLDAAQKQALLDYTRANAAETSSHKRSRRIMDCLRGATPLRITEIPYIIRKHRRLAPDVVARKAVGGLHNCNACHPGATQMDFKDDNVRIPQ